MSLNDPLQAMALYMAARMINQQRQPRKQNPRPSIWKRRGRYLVRRLGILLMRIGGKLIYLGQNPLED